MSQDELIILLFKIVLIACEVGVVSFVAVYSALAAWWANPIGRTLVQLDILLGLALLPSILSLFFRFSRFTSHVAAWVDMGIFAAIAFTLFARIPLWIRLHRAKAAQAAPVPPEGGLHAYPHSVLRLADGRSVGQSPGLHPRRRVGDGTGPVGQGYPRRNTGAA